MFADPAGDDVVDRLRRGVHIHHAARVAGQGDGLGQFQPEAVAGQADGAGAMHRAIEAPGEPCQQRVGRRGAAQETHLRPAPEALVHQHAEMQPGIQRFHHPDRCGGAGGDQFAHHRAAHGQDVARDRAVVRRAIERGRGQAVALRGHRRQFPIRQMGREDHRGLAVFQQLAEAFDAVGRQFDAAGIGIFQVPVPQRAEMDVLRCGAAEILPALAEDRGALGLGLLGEGGGDVLARDAVLRRQRCEQPRAGSAEIGCAVRPERAHQREGAAHQRGQGFIAQPLKLSAHRAGKAACATSRRPSARRRAAHQPTSPLGAPVACAKASCRRQRPPSEGITASR